MNGLWYTNFQIFTFVALTIWNINQWEHLVDKLLSHWEQDHLITYCGRYAAYLKNMMSANVYIEESYRQKLGYEEIIDMIEAWNKVECEDFQERIILYQEQNSQLPQAYPNWIYNVRP